MYVYNSLLFDDVNVECMFDRKIENSDSWSV